MGVFWVGSVGELGREIETGEIAGGFCASEGLGDWVWVIDFGVSEVEWVAMAKLFIFLSCFCLL